MFPMRTFMELRSQRQEGKSIYSEGIKSLAGKQLDYPSPSRSPSKKKNDISRNRGCRHLHQLPVAGNRHSWRTPLSLLLPKRNASMAVPCNAGSHSIQRRLSDTPRTQCTLTNNNMIERQEAYTFKCPHCGHGKARQVVRRDIKYLIDPEPAMDELFSIRVERNTKDTSIECSHCRHVWNSMQQSIVEGAFRVTTIRTTVTENIS